MKKKLPSFIKKLLRESTHPPVRVVFFIILFTSVGITLLLTRAASPSVGTEAESGTLAGGANAVTDSNASGGSYVKFGQPPPPPPPFTGSATALTVVATDEAGGSYITSNAICVDNYAIVSGDHVTACIQVNPSNNSQARGGTYNITQKKFEPATSWISLPDVTTAGKVASKLCNNTNHAFAALGPLGNTYYGEEINGSAVKFGSLDANSNCNTGGGGALTSSEWATAAIYCSASPTTTVSTLAGLISAVSNDGNGSEICVAPGNYTFTASMSTIRPKTNMKIIGKSPIQRPIFDSSAIPTGQGYTSAFGVGGTSITLANLVVQGAQTTGVKNGSCPNCGFGIDGADGVHVYNVKMHSNQENGFHFAYRGGTLNYLVENSELSDNGNSADQHWSSGGLKTTSAGVMKHNVVVYNIGEGMWCDGNDPSTAVCHYGTWRVVDNYVSKNTGDGIHYEIAFNNPGAVIQYNVLNCNNTENLFYQAGIGIYGAYVIANNNNFDNRKDASHTCINNHQGVYVYSDNRSPPAPYTHDVNVTNNIMHGDAIDCSSNGPYGGNVVCTPNF